MSPIFYFIFHLLFTSSEWMDFRDVRPKKPICLVSKTDRNKQILFAPALRPWRLDGEQNARIKFQLLRRVRFNRVRAELMQYIYIYNMSIGTRTYILFFRKKILKSYKHPAAIWKKNNDLIGTSATIHSTRRVVKIINLLFEKRYIGSLRILFSLKLYRYHLYYKI